MRIYLRAFSLLVSAVLLSTVALAVPASDAEVNTVLSTTLIAGLIAMMGVVFAVVVYFGKQGLPPDVRFARLAFGPDTWIYMLIFVVAILALSVSTLLNGDPVILESPLGRIETSYQAAFRASLALSLLAVFLLPAYFYWQQHRLASARVVHMLERQTLRQVRRGDEFASQAIAGLYTAALHGLDNRDNWMFNAVVSAMARVPARLATRVGNESEEQLFEGTLSQVDQRLVRLAVEVRENPYALMALLAADRSASELLQKQTGPRLKVWRRNPERQDRRRARRSAFRHSRSRLERVAIYLNQHEEPAESLAYVVGQYLAAAYVAPGLLDPPGRRSMADFAAALVVESLSDPSEERSGAAIRRFTKGVNALAQNDPSEETSAHVVACATELFKQIGPEISQGLGVRTHIAVQRFVQEHPDCMADLYVQGSSSQGLVTTEPLDWGVFVGLHACHQGVAHGSRIGPQGVVFPGDFIEPGDRLAVGIDDAYYDNDGQLMIDLSVDDPSIPPLLRQIEDIVGGLTTEGTVDRTTEYGVFVALPFGRAGLAHQSRIGSAGIIDPSSHFEAGDHVAVGIDDAYYDNDGQLRIDLRLS